MASAGSVLHPSCVSLSSALSQSLFCFRGPREGQIWDPVRPAAPNTNTIKSAQLGSAPALTLARSRLPFFPEKFVFGLFFGVIKSTSSWEKFGFFPRFLLSVTDFSGRSL